MNDDQLHRLLREAPPELPTPDSFGREVWARIEAEESLTFAACVARLGEWFFAWVARPVPALVTISAFVALGAFLGTAADEPGAGDAISGELAYVRSINPLDRHALHEP